jgi:hypothetical protein
MYTLHTDGSHVWPTPRRFRVVSSGVCRQPHFPQYNIFRCACEEACTNMHIAACTVVPLLEVNSRAGAGLLL